MTFRPKTVFYNVTNTIGYNGHVYNIIKALLDSSLYNTNLLICLFPISIGKKSSNLSFISQLFFQDGNKNKWRAMRETFA